MMAPFAVLVALENIYESFMPTPIICGFLSLSKATH